MVNRLTVELWGLHSLTEGNRFSTRTQQQEAEVPDQYGSDWHGFKTLIVGIHRPYSISSLEMYVDCMYHVHY